MKFETLEQIANQYGEAFYILETEKFKSNYNELLNSFTEIYENTQIAYSYKTNYIPKICKIVNDFGGYAEIVSDMEYELAIKIGVNPKNIIFNGPYKKIDAIKELLLSGGIVNIDSYEEFRSIISIAKQNTNSNIKIGIRSNFNIVDGEISRFGIDVKTSEFSTIINEISNQSNLSLEGFHCHFANRDLDSWKHRTNGMIEVMQKHNIINPKFIDLGGGIFGHMKDSLKEQFKMNIPTFKEYASTAVTLANYFDVNSINPKLFIEPGSALVGDVMMFIAKVISIKCVQNKNIATLVGSIYNINPTLNKKNPPITIISNPKNENKLYNNLDFGGYTCIETDYLYKGFNGELSVGDYVLFENVGSYSIVLKPPFILPNFPILELDNNKVNIIKKQETFNDIFGTYEFDF